MGSASSLGTFNTDTDNRHVQQIGRIRQIGKIGRIRQVGKIGQIRQCEQIYHTNSKR